MQCKAEKLIKEYIIGAWREQNNSPAWLVSTNVLNSGLIHLAIYVQKQAIAGYTGL